MDFQADDRLVFREHLGSDGRFLWSGFRHNETKIIAPAGGASPAPTGRIPFELCQESAQLGPRPDGGSRDPPPHVEIAQFLPEKR